MKHKRLLILLAVLVVLIVVACVNALMVLKQAQPAKNSPASNAQPIPPLITDNAAPIGLIGTITALGTTTVTIEGQPPGNTSPVTLTVLVDAKTSITKVGPPPAYATSTANFSNLKTGILLNIAATAAQNGARHAERIIIPARS
jgi:hypothetical protein